MTHQEIIKLSQEIAAQYSKAERFQTWTHDFMMQRLMELVSVSAAAEREACAQIGDGYDYGDRNCGDEIRARGIK